MNIRELLNKLNSAETEQQQSEIMSEIKQLFDNLSPEEQAEVQADFNLAFDEKMQEGQQLIERIDLAIELAQAAKYVSLSEISKNYFGKSRSWLHQRIKGNIVHGKPARFTSEERRKLSHAFEDISKLMHHTALKLSRAEE